MGREKGLIWVWSISEGAHGVWVLLTIDQDFYNAMKLRCCSKLLHKRSCRVDRSSKSIM